MLRFFFTLVSLFFFLPTSSWAEQSTHIGYFKNISGEVFVTREENTLLAKAGTQLLSSDVIRTGSDSSAGIFLIDNTRLSLGEKTELSLNEYKFVPVDENYAFSLFLKKGKMLYSSGKLTKLAPEKINIQTPRATVGVRGTTFLVQVD